MPSSRGLQGIISLFGFRGLASSPIAKSGSDSGAGTESSDIGQSVAGSDAGTGTEETPTLASALPDEDTGAGTEESSVLAVTLSASDTGSGADVSGYSVQSALGDSGLGAESSSLAIAISSSDVGVGAEVSDLMPRRILTIEVTSIESDLTVEYDE